eukprot:7179983-Alexandrium_andersonii.AAC.1
MVPAHEHRDGQDDLHFGAGEAYVRPHSIPQGCPLSMCWLGVLIAPLASEVAKAGAVPRALADDISVAAKGGDRGALGGL